MTTRDSGTLAKIGEALAKAEVFVADVYDEALPPIMGNQRDLSYQNGAKDLDFDEPHNLSNLLHDSERDAISSMAMVIKMSLELNKNQREVLLDILLDNLI